MSNVFHFSLRIFKSRKSLIFFGQLLVIVAALIRNKCIAGSSIDVFSATTLAITTIQFFLDFAVFGSDLIAIKLTPNLRIDEKNKFTTNFIVYYFSLSLISVFLFFIFFYLNKNYFKGLPYLTILLFPMLIIINFINLGFMSVRKAQNRLSRILVINLLTFLGIICSLIFIVIKKSDLFISLTVAFPAIFSLLYVVFDLRKEFYFGSIQVEYIKKNIFQNFKYGFTFSLASMMPVLIFMLLRIKLVELDESLHQLSFFVVGFALVHSYFGLFLTTFSTVIIPRLTQRGVLDDFIRRNIKLEIKNILLLSIAISSVYVFLGKGILELLYSKEFTVVYPFLLFAIPGLIMRSFTFILNLVYVIKKLPNVLLRLELVYNTTFLVLAFLLLEMTNDFKYLGLAYTLSYFIYFIISYYSKYNVIREL